MKKKTCVWEYCSDDGTWSTECGETFLYGWECPVAHNFKFCPYCGKPLEVKP